MLGLGVQDIFGNVPEIDFETGYKYFFGNMENYKRALMSILKSIKAKLPLLESMIMTDEYEGLRTITQTLRRMFGNIGANSLSELSYQLEMSLLNENKAILKENLENYMNHLFVFSENLEQLLKSLDVNSIEKEEVSFCNYDFTKTKESIKHSAHLLGRKII